MKPNDKNTFAQFAKGKIKAKEGRERKGVAYTRVSSYEQLNNTSLEVQIRETRANAMKDGVPLVREFGGTYESAKSDNERTEFKAMLTYVNRNPSITDVYVYDYSRFSRTGGNAIAIVDKLRERGVSVHAVTQPTDGDTAAGKMMQSMTLIYSHIDNEIRREKTVSGTLERLNEGHYCTTAPKGYINTKVDGVKTIVPDPKFAPLIRKAFRWKAEEGISNEAIRKRMKALGWAVAKNTISRVLQNPVYCGILAHNLLNGETRKGNWKPLISKDLFLKANGVNAKYIKGYKVNADESPFPLKCFLRCNCCGGTMVGYEQKKKNGKLRPKAYVYYKCNEKGCKTNISGKKLHEAFQTEIEKYTIAPDLLAPIRHQLEALIAIQDDGQFETLDRMRKTLAEVERKIEVIETKHIFDEIPEALYQKHRPKLDTEKEEIEQKLMEAARQVSNLESFISEGLEIAANLAVLWENGDFQDRQRVQSLVFPDGISYDKENGNYRTPRVNSVFSLIDAAQAVFEQKNSGTNELKKPFVPLRTRSGNRTSQSSLSWEDL